MAMFFSKDNPSSLKDGTIVPPFIRAAAAARKDVQSVLDCALDCSLDLVDARFAKLRRIRPFALRRARSGFCS